MILVLFICQPWFSQDSDSGRKIKDIYESFAHGPARDIHCYSAMYVILIIKNRTLPCLSIISDPNRNFAHMHSAQEQINMVLKLILYSLKFYGLKCIHRHTYMCIKNCWFDFLNCQSFSSNYRLQSRTKSKGILPAYRDGSQSFSVLYIHQLRH